MLQSREWQDEPELFETVASALEDCADITVIARDEHGDYSERGYIIIITEDGRRFRLSLNIDS